VIIGIGTDMIEVERIEEMASGGRQYLEAIFTEKEIDYCENKVRKSEHYAARFAAKEAVLKALGTGWRDGLVFTDIEILNEEHGEPRIHLHGKVKSLFEHLEIKRAFVSLSHIKKMAIAFAVLEE
jgi:holo-[acyl-carrier protein] synthase